MSIAQRMQHETAALARDVRAAVRGHDLTLIAAGTTFYLAIAVVPMVLVAIRLASLLVGPARILHLGLELAHRLPATLGADRVTRAMVEAGSHLTWMRALLSLIPASLYGEGLRRAFQRLSPQESSGVRTAWKGRAIALPLLTVSPLLTVAVLVVGTEITSRVGTGVGGTLLGGYLAFLSAWILVSLTLVLLYRALAPDRPRVPALLLGAFGTGSFVAGFLIGFAIFLQIPLQIGSAYGGFAGAGAVAVAGGWLLLLHALVLIGYSVTLCLDTRLGQRRSVAASISLALQPRTEAPTP